jgi:F420-dependent oxidoreductase-like protein
MTAMTAATLDMMSGGRFLLGIGASGPQVSEGWYGEVYGKPLGRTREYVDILRKVWAREAPLEHHGEHYDIPYSGPGATGLGKPLKIIVHPLRPEVPIYLAAIGPRNVALTAEIADGWLPIFFSPAHYAGAYQAAVEAGFAKAGGGKSMANFDIAPTVPVVLGDDVDACRASVKPFIALYVGGMGAKGKNFYYDLAVRYGFQEAADRVQELYLAGRKEEATAAIPDELVDAVALCGPKRRIAERLERWQASPVGTLNMSTFDVEAVRLMAELVLGPEAGRPDRTVSIPSEVAPAGAPVTAGAATADAPDVAAIFAGIARRVAANPGLVQRVNAVFEFRLTGEPAATWVVDLKNGAGEVRAGAADLPDCTVTMSAGDFTALAAGRLNGMAAFQSGKLKVQGNPMLALKLQEIFAG